MGFAKKIDHVAIAVKDLDAAVQTFTTNLGFPVERVGEVPRLGIRSAWLTIGDAALELFQPLSAGNPAAQFIAERGEGMYVLALEVGSMAAAVGRLAQQGIAVAVQQLDDGTKVAFLSPKVTHGVTLQLIEHPT